jgi:hypothetical protein
MQSHELLTHTEHELVRDLGEIYNTFCRIIDDGPARGSDTREVASHIHALQNMVLSQASRRAFPELYRSLGGSSLPQYPEGDL